MGRELRWTWTVSSLHGLRQRYSLLLTSSYPNFKAQLFACHQPRLLNYPSRVIPLGEDSPR